MMESFKNDEADNRKREQWIERKYEGGKGE